ncbi:hypothetical protein [Aquisalibacillus elongatus]|uniref:Uncharacterized protein n=1 Tax=Aquisalibacillus elongatus TaxID=485577 RepID=A0A3N5C5A8_9BACI|nr:hypothetical protein [Aquisalibacillus elongatus]RPF53355.1 hypothetical protein EDC24_1854 [Aquisalibacillus elongatus]
MKRKLIALVLGLGFLFVPLFVELANPFVYIIVVAIYNIIWITRVLHEDYLDERFYKKWSILRQKSVFYLIIREWGLLSTLALVFLVGERVIFEGVHPLDYLESIFDLSRLVLFLFTSLIFSIGIAFAMKYENEKRYKRLRWKYEKQASQAG